ncbi:hypothetical protein GCM10012275_17340 [Longimycelium tulufanense]|uniref:Bacterial SCP orthologue domain-containing protein n=2 Tax=Longimycelium tulufanense TaxID=907463 RepID=A0A8J3CE35_9PSEU|nr:hypothetical protein GCM10012275_17340 [Longimycelium tulufanense]
MSCLSPIDYSPFDRGASIMTGDSSAWRLARDKPGRGPPNRPPNLDRQPLETVDRRRRIFPDESKQTASSQPIPRAPQLTPVHNLAGMPRRAVDPHELRAAVHKVMNWVDGAAPEPPRAEVAAAVRLSLRTLEQIAPGRSVEVRVPPFAAIQCVAGPGHTRGTPPNVIETDPHTWLRLATGRLLWTEALVEGRVNASGSRADLDPWLPLLRPGE